jgi:DNA-binding NarL/FixJ family response regulator
MGMYKDNLPTLFGICNKNQCYILFYSRREREIIKLLCQGKTVNEIANKLNIAEKTIETHLTEIYKKAKVRGRSEFLIYAIKEGLNFSGTDPKG